MTFHARALCALALAGCAAAAGPDAVLVAEHPAPTREAARGLAYTETFEIRFDGEIVGYLVEVKPVPEGVSDARAYPPDTALIQGPDLEFLGFLSPSGTSYRFDAQGRAHALSWGTRKAAIAHFFRRTGMPRLLPVGTGA